MNITAQQVHDWLTENMGSAQCVKETQQIIRAWIEYPDLKPIVEKAKSLGRTKLNAFQQIHSLLDDGKLSESILTVAKRIVDAYW